MSHSLVWSPRADKAMAKLDKQLSKRIFQRMLEVAAAPYDYLEKITTEGGYRARAGDYRLFIDMDKEKRELHVLAVRHRRAAYKKK